MDTHLLYMYRACIFPELQIKYCAYIACMHCVYTSSVSIHTCLWSIVPCLSPCTGSAVGGILGIIVIVVLSVLAIVFALLAVKR